MKNTRRRLLAAIMAAAMAAGVMSGCGTAQAAYDPIQDVMGYPGSTVMFTVNGNDVTAADYFYWMAQNVDYVASYYSAMGSDIVWTDSMGDEVTMDQYVKDSSRDTAVVYSIVTAKAEELGYGLTEEDEASFDEQMEQAKTAVAGQAGEENKDEAYANWLKSMCLTEDGIRKLTSVGTLYSHMEEGMLREGSEYAPDRASLDAYVQENDLLSAKHILLLTTDMASGTDLDDAARAEKKATAEDILAQLQAVQDDPEALAAKFDELMHQYSEDTGLTAYPDGYVFSAGEMVPEFEDATRALEPGAISGIVESSYGYHIILRQDAASSAEVLEACGGDVMDDLLNDWVDEAEVVTTETYDALTTEEFYTNLTAFRATLEPDDAETAELDDAESTEQGDADNAETSDEPAEEAAE